MMNTHPDDQNFSRHIRPLDRLAAGEVFRTEQLKSVASGSAYAFRSVRAFLLDVADAGGPHAEEAQRLMQTSGIEGLAK